MSVINQLAAFQNRSDDEPNRQLAIKLAASGDLSGIREIVDNLKNPDVNVQSDCIKVLYEIGALQPGLISGYVNEFIELIKSKNNRLVWGAMMTLSYIAHLVADVIYENLDLILDVKRRGSVITVDNAVSVLSVVASANPEYSPVIFPLLLDHLAVCRPKEIPQHAERIFPAVNSSNKAGFIRILEKRLENLSTAGQVRVKKLINQAARL